MSETDRRTGEQIDPIKFRVAWRNPGTGVSGYGEPVRRSTAEAWVAYMANHLPAIEHWVEEAGLVDDFCGPGKVAETENRYPGTVPWAKEAQ